MDELLKQIELTQMQLKSERMEILGFLREQKERDLLLMALENNVTSSRRINAVKESVLLRSVNGEKETDLNQKPASRSIEQAFSIKHVKPVEEIILPDGTRPPEGDILYKHGDDLSMYINPSAINCS